MERCAEWGVDGRGWEDGDVEWVVLLLVSLSMEVVLIEIIYILPYDAQTGYRRYCCHCVKFLGDRGVICLLIPVLGRLTAENMGS